MGLADTKIAGMRYNSPWTQVVLVGFVAFCSVGMYSAISNLGAGGTQDVQLSDTANSVLYACFFLGGFFSGSINNMLGPRLTMSLGTIGYCIYLGALWNFQVRGTRWFLILAGAILGFTASLFWSAQGCVMMSYPTEKDKGRSFTIFWAIFQLGTLVGAAIAFGIEFDSTLPSVSTRVYIAFIVIMFTSIASSWLILPPQLVVRGDGTLVKLEKAPSPKTEFHAFVSMFKDWRMLALFPMFFASNYFYAYQGAITAFLYNGRTRALVALLTGLGSIIGSIVIGFITDNLPMGRRSRAYAGFAVTLFLLLLVWCSGLGFQVQFHRKTPTLGGLTLPWDLKDSPAAGPITLMLAYYVVDAAYQGLAYYIMACMTNDPFRLARMAGYYKSIQSAGSAVSFGMDAVKTSYLCEHLVSWLLIMISMPLCFLVICTIRKTNYDVEEVAVVDNKNVVLEHAEVNGAESPAH